MVCERHLADIMKKNRVIVFIQGAPDELEAVGLLWSFLEILCERKVNFLFTTHFTRLFDITKENLPIIWVRFTISREKL